MTPSIGPFEELVLLSLERLGGAYATDVCNLVNAAGYHFSDQNGSMYNILERLEAKGCVASTITASRPMRGGRSRRHYTITEAGKRATAEVETIRQCVRTVPL